MNPLPACTGRPRPRSGIRNRSTGTKREPDFRNRLARAIEDRHEALRHTGGLNEEVFDSLVVMVAGAITPEAIAEGARKVQALIKDMADSRYVKLVRLGFEPDRARHLSSLHTRNFM